MEEKNGSDGGAAVAPTEQKGALTAQEVAHRIGMSVKFVVSNRRKIPGAFRAGRYWRFDRLAVERAIQIQGSLF